MPSEPSVRSNFLRLLGSLRNLRNYLMRRRDPNMSLLTRNFIADFSANKVESKQSIVNKNLSQNYSADVEKLCSTEKDKSEYTHMPNSNVSNVFECGRNNPDVPYERSDMTNEGNEYFTDILGALNKYQNRHGQRLSSKKYQRSCSPHHRTR